MDKTGQERGIFAQSQETSHRPLIAALGSRGKLFSKLSRDSRERYIFIKKEEGTTILDSLIVTGIKMTRTPSNETILFSFN